MNIFFQLNSPYATEGGGEVGGRKGGRGVAVPKESL